jgi:hypothetical protein
MKDFSGNWHADYWRGALRILAPLLWALVAIAVLGWLDAPVIFMAAAALLGQLMTIRRISKAAARFHAKSARAARGIAIAKAALRKD